ncbi:hypothetical protein CL656_03240 [bacterium]|nr:hypothetical protein [bacterium]|tara:strand:- start:8607 stop:9464 length:858 start_codon:yes stop_codon:yes gene_type:complete
MKNLHLILKKGNNQATLSLLLKSAKQRNLNVNIIYIEEFDFTQKINLNKNDLLYRISTSRKAQMVEKFLLNSEVTTFYKDNLRSISKYDNVIEATLMHEKANLPIIPTIYCLTNNKKILQKEVDHLGGFPIIIKAQGGQNGNGVMKIESIDSLKSILDYLLLEDKAYVLRKFIKHKEQLRLIVVDDKVVANHTNLATEDFRSNANIEKRQRIIKDYPQEIYDIGVKAINTCGFEFGAVDVLIEEETQKPYIAEVNMPAFFPRTQELTNIDISGQMLDYLIHKSER